MTVKHIIKPSLKSLGDFSVRRALPDINVPMVGPWIFFDHMGPADFKAGHGIDVRPHPHINLATVTYLFEGEILHRDSLGSEQRIRPGEINLMVAGRGITHSEREHESVRSQPHKQHGLQLWHALPEAVEEIEPAFYHYGADELPTTINGTVEVRVMIGEAYGLTSPVKTFCDTLYTEVKLASGDDIETPKSEELAVYVIAGAISIDEQNFDEGTMLVLAPHEPSKINARSDCQLAIIGGEKMTKRHIEWNFVSSKKERIQQAKKDWIDGRFPKVVGDEDEFIPFP